MKKVIVTGGAGFIGSHIVDKLISLGVEVIVLDNLSSGKKENINPKAEFHQNDLANTFKRMIEVERSNRDMGREGAIQSVRDYFYKGEISKEIVEFCQSRPAGFEST